VAQDEDGIIYHGRNLDYGFPGLQNLTLSASFQSNGEEVYHGVAFVGYVGLLTGMRSGKFAVSMDMREYVDRLTIPQIFEGWAKNKFSYKTGGDAIGFTIRDALEESGRVFVIID